MFLQNLLRDYFQNFYSQTFFRLPRQKRIALFFIGFFIGICIFALVTPQLAPVSAQSTQAIVREILDGNQIYIQNRPAAIDDVVSQKQLVRTGDSRTALLFNSGAIVRLSRNSFLKFGECLYLRQGKILVNGAINICSKTIGTIVSNPTYLLEVDESGNQEIKVLEEQIIVKRSFTPFDEFDDRLPSNSPSNINPLPMPQPSPRQTNVSVLTISSKLKQFNNLPNLNLPPDNPLKSRPLEPLKVDPVNDRPVLKIEQSNQNPEQVTLKAGEKIAIDSKGNFGLIQQITESEFTSLLKSSLFQGFSNQLPSTDKIRAVFERLFPQARF